MRSHEDFLVGGLRQPHEPASSSQLANIKKNLRVFVSLCPSRPGKWADGARGA